MPETVLISGATGFIAAHTVLQLLQSGYNVVGSVRSVEKGEKFKSLLNNPNFSYEVVENIESEGAFDQFVKQHPEATVFLHTASPFHFRITNIEKDLLEPAVFGTKNALLAVKKYGPQIRSVVVTSSHAAIGDVESGQDPNLIETEDSWCKLNWETSQQSNRFGYCGSKTLAEKAAWEFVKTEKPNFTLTTVNPTYVFGPQPFEEQAKCAHLNTSSEIVNNVLLSTNEEECGHIVGGVVDVRDVAAAHLVAFEKDEAKGKRLFLVAGQFTTQTILDVLHSDFPAQSTKVPIGKPGSDAEELSGRTIMDNSRTKKLLGFPLRSVRETIHDSIEQILRYRA